MDNPNALPEGQPIEASFGIKEDWLLFSKAHQVLLTKLPLLFKTFERVFLRTMETTEPADRVIYFLGRVAMEEQEAGARIDRGERVEMPDVERVLERDDPSVPAPEDVLQLGFVKRVGGTHVLVEQPAGVGGYVVADPVDRAAKRIAQQALAFVRTQRDNASLCAW